MSWLIIKQESQRYREVFERRVGILLKGKSNISNQNSSTKKVNPHWRGFQNMVLWSIGLYSQYQCLRRIQKFGIHSQEGDQEYFDLFIHEQIFIECL